MIQAKNLSKKFDDVLAIDNISFEIQDKSIFGLIGTNGAGKSTFLKIAAGILKPDKGEVLFDNENIFENEVKKQEFFYISDNHFFFRNSSVNDALQFYSNIYDNFDVDKCKKLLDSFNLKLNRKINTFSKGMKKQLLIILALSANTKYIFCDETFDGLDPVMRQSVKSLFAKEMEDRGLTPIIASHNLREIEDICDHVGLLHQGGILLSKEIEEMKEDLNKIQVVFKDKKDLEKLSDLDIIIKKESGSILTLTIRATKEVLLNRFDSIDTVFLEIIPLTLEEIFISETEVLGYDIKKLIS